MWTTFNSWQWDLDWSNPDVVCALRRHHPVPRQPRRRGAPPRRHRLHLEAPRHDVAEPARGPRHHPGPARRHPRSPPGAWCSRPRRSSRRPTSCTTSAGARHHGKVSDLAYHNSLMVQIWSMLASRDVRLSVHVLRAISEVPSTTAWITYVRCHDDIGWAIDDADAAAVGLSGPAHRAFLSDYYSGDFWQSPARGARVPAQRGDGRPPHQRDDGQPGRAGRGARAPGTTSGRAVRRIDRILLAHTIVLGWGGVPVLWMGDELALRNDPALGRRPGPRRRQPLGPPAPRCRGTVADRRHQAGTVEQRVFDGLVHRARVRAGLAAPPRVGAVASRSTRPIPASWPSLRRHPRRARCSASTTSPTPSGRSRRGACRRRPRAVGDASTRITGPARRRRPPGRTPPPPVRRAVARLSVGATTVAASPADLRTSADLELDGGALVEVGRDALVDDGPVQGVVAVDEVVLERR